MVRPSPEFFLLMFALFKAGAVPVLVDPGIARSALKQSRSVARPSLSTESAAMPACN
jgi:acyl-CoA synthetase (AMP-forming)/AMP-acid ligase II